MKVQQGTRECQSKEGGAQLPDNNKKGLQQQALTQPGAAAGNRSSREPQRETRMCCSKEQSLRRAAPPDHNKGQQQQQQAAEPQKSFAFSRPQEAPGSRRPSRDVHPQVHTTPTRHEEETHKDSDDNNEEVQTTTLTRLGGGRHEANKHTDTHAHTPMTSPQHTAHKPPTHSSAAHSLVAQDKQAFKYGKDKCQGTSVTETDYPLLWTLSQ